MWATIQERDRKESVAVVQLGSTGRPMKGDLGLGRNVEVGHRVALSRITTMLHTREAVLLSPPTIEATITISVCDRHARTRDGQLDCAKGGHGSIHLTSRWRFTPHQPH